MSEVTRIYCDGKAKNGPCRQVMSGRQAEFARSAATRAGWLMLGGQHYCPDCQRAPAPHRPAVTR